MKNSLNSFSGGLFIPIEILCNKDLTLFEKVILSRINTFKPMGFFGSSAWLATDLSSSVQTIKNAICKFKRMGFVSVEYREKRFIRVLLENVVNAMPKEEEIPDIGDGEPMDCDSEIPDEGVTGEVHHRNSASTPESQPYITELSSIVTPPGVSDRKVMEIYNAYPRKVGRPHALKAIRKAIRKTQADPEVVLSQTKKYNAVSASIEDRYVPHPARWFNEHRFNDDPKTWVRNGKPEIKQCSAKDAETF